MKKMVKRNSTKIGSDDEDIDDGQHAKLLAAIDSLDGPKRASLSARVELAPQVSEFHVSSTKEKVKLHELLGSVKKSSKHGEIKKQIARVQKKKKVLTVPLAKPEQERIHRTIAYEATSEEVSKWDPIVHKNRLADQLQFPLERADLRLQETANQFVKKLKPRTPLEVEVAKLLQGNKDSEFSDDKLLTPAEERALQAMSVEEAKERRAELQKYRALLSYKQAKAHRQKKIKSKGYHRILKKERMRSEKSQLEALQHNDPEAYLEEMEEVEKVRMEERITLKHRGGSKFSQRQKMYSKYNDAARQAVQDMIQKNKELTHKRRESSSSDDEGCEVDIVNIEGSKSLENSLQLMNGKQNNPWMLSSVAAKKLLLKTDMNTDNAPIEDVPVQKESAVQENISSSSESEVEPDMDDIFSTLEKNKTIAANERRSPPRTQSKNKKRKKLVKKSKESKSSDSSDLSDSQDDECIEKDGDAPETEEKKQDEGLLLGSLTRRKNLSDFEGHWEEDNIVASISKSVKLDKTIQNQSPSNTNIQVDPKNIMTVESSIHHPLPHVGIDKGDEDQIYTAEQTQKMTIAEAFATDDVVEEFRQEKSQMEERDKPKDIDLTMPGWGDWGGEGVQPPKRKKKRFFKAPEAAPRKDRHLNNVIISETKNTTISKHQVNELPFPFTNIQQFEASVRQPIGKNWNPETAYKQMIKPKVVTRMGTIIDPIDKAEIFKKHKNKKKKF